MMICIADQGMTFKLFLLVNYAYVCMYVSVCLSVKYECNNAFVGELILDKHTTP